jgi:tRNA dimethylallyltransferase
VLEGTGRSLADWQRTPGEPIVDEQSATRLLVMPDRAQQVAAIDARFDAMVGAGALEEVRALLTLGLSPELPVMRALGVAPLAAHLRGEMLLDAAIEAAKAETRQYAKRQLTWLRRNMISWKWLSTQEIESIEAGSLRFIDS